MWTWILNFTPFPWPTVATDSMTNTLDRLLFVTRFNQRWTAVGYKIVTNGTANGVGPLYQYRASGPPTTGGSVANAPLLNDFLANTNQPPLNRVIDGVVNFRVRAYDTNGIPMEQAMLARTDPIPGFYTFPGIYVSSVSRNVFNPPDVEYTYTFSSNAVPAYVEVELSVLESKTLEHFLGMSATPPLPATT